MKKLTALIIVMVALCVPHIAIAKQSETPGQAAWQVALQFWGGELPTDCTSQEVKWDSTPPEWAGHLAAATAPTSPEPCVMWIAPDMRIYLLCVVVVHEYGHWLGYQWGYDPHSITYDGDQSEDPWEPGRIGGCVRMARRFEGQDALYPPKGDNGLA